MSDASIDEGLETLESRRQKYVAGLLIRVTVCAIFIAVFTLTAQLIPGSSRSHFWIAIALLFALMAINYPFWLLGKRSRFPLRHFYGHWLLDLLLVTLILHMLGGVELPCGFVGYLIMILTSAVFLSQQASYIVAAGSALFYDGMVLLERIGILPPQNLIWDHEYTLAAQVIIVLASNVIFFLFSYLAGSLAQQLRRANMALARAQEELQEYNRTLERSVRIRTAALEEKTNEIEEFVHIVTHDLRNVSIGAAEVARRLAVTENATLSPKGQRYAQNLLEDTRNMNRMLTHLLELFRVDHEKERLELVDVMSVAKELLEVNRSRIQDKNISVHVETLPRVFVDPHQMSHVLANLVDNAIKYCGDKEAPIISLECVEENAQYVFCVRDNGIGISPGQITRVFQMYHRGPDQSVGGVQQDGQGVGLTITKRIVERWGGQIWVESTVGSGSAFYFTCPKDRMGEREAS